MKIGNFFALFQEGKFRTAQFVFDNGSTRYTYLVPIETPIAVDDKFIVYGSGKQLRTVTCVEVDEEPNIDYESSTIAYSWVVQKVDLTEYTARMDKMRKFSKVLAEVNRVEQRDRLAKAAFCNLTPGSTAARMFSELAGEYGVKLEHDTVV